MTDLRRLTGDVDAGPFSFRAPAGGSHETVQVMYRGELHDQGLDFAGSPEVVDRQVRRHPRKDPAEPRQRVEIWIPDNGRDGNSEGRP